MNLIAATAALHAKSLIAGHSRNTRKTYIGWLRDYAREIKAGRAVDLQSYLDHLATGRRLHPKTIKQAVCALVFFTKQVLGREPGQLRFPRPTVGANRRAPDVLSHHECLALLSGLDRVPRLQASLLYGSGLRITEALTLRLKDIDLDGRIVTIHAGKGDKDRVVRLPEAIVPALADQIHRCRGAWRRDQMAGRICPSPRESLVRKLGRGTFASLPWYWLFPSRIASDSERWHATTHGLSKAIKAAAEGAGITKRVTAHGLRHSYATSLLRTGTDIRTLQVQLGHTHVETTEIYAHAAGHRACASPLDGPLNVIELASYPAPAARRAGRA